MSAVMMRIEARREMTVMVAPELSAVAVLITLRLQADTFRPVWLANFHG